MNELPIEKLREYLRYDSESGEIYSKIRPVSDFKNERSWAIHKTQFAGKVTFRNIDRYGYFQGTIWGKKYFAHRVIWALHYGKWPEGEIDHINGNPADNRIENLREVTRWENQKNIKMQARNTSGTVGVQWSKQANRWTAIISVDKKPKSLGFFKEKADAIAARKFAEIKYGYHPNHGRAA